MNAFLAIKRHLNQEEGFVWNGKFRFGGFCLFVFVFKINLY